jgi:hypothetical protein
VTGGIEAALIGLARLTAAVGQLELAARLMSAAEALRERAGLSISLRCREYMDEVAAAARATLGKDALRAAVASGGSAPLAELSAEVLGWVESVALVTHAQTGPERGVPSAA